MCHLIEIEENAFCCESKNILIVILLREIGGIFAFSPGFAFVCCTISHKENGSGIASQSVYRIRREVHVGDGSNVSAVVKSFEDRTRSQHHLAVDDEAAKGALDSDPSQSTRELLCD